MRFLNAIMAPCFRRGDCKSADGYFCFTLEHGGSRQALLMRLMQRTLSSAQCLAGGPFEFFPDVQSELTGLCIEGLSHQSSVV
jgi:hypothetical protein